MFVRRTNVVSGVSVFLYLISFFPLFASVPIFFNGSLQTEVLMSYLNPIGLTILGIYQIPASPAYGSAPLLYFLISGISWILGLFLISMIKFKKLEL
jgi:hypothetical protein